MVIENSSPSSVTFLTSAPRYVAVGWAKNRIPLERSALVRKRLAAATLSGSAARAGPAASRARQRASSTFAGGKLRSMDATPWRADEDRGGRPSARKPADRPARGIAGKLQGAAGARAATPPRRGG